MFVNSVTVNSVTYRQNCYATMVTILTILKVLAQNSTC